MEELEKAVDAALAKREEWELSKQKALIFNHQMSTIVLTLVSLSRVLRAVEQVAYPPGESEKVRQAKEILRQRG